MGKETGISWASHTANFWWGCMKVSPGCKHCYAETLSNRYGKSIWGTSSITERELKKGVWKDILQWDKDAKQANERRRVFVMSMGDFLEDHPQVYQWREDAKCILENLQWLDVLMLTKRPENANVFLSDWASNWPSHIWLGTSVENQEQADIRIPHLLDTNAKIKFLSCEPLLGEVTINKPVQISHEDNEGYGIAPINYLSWVICGGESGHNARSMNTNWARSLRDQCVSSGVPFHFKQFGEYIDIDSAIGIGLTNSYDGKYSPYTYIPNTSLPYIKVGKSKSGHVLDGETWQEFPVIGGC